MLTALHHNFNIDIESSSQHNVLNQSSKVNRNSKIYKAVTNKWQHEIMDNLNNVNAGDVPEEKEFGEMTDPDLSIDELNYNNFDENINLDENTNLDGYWVGFFNNLVSK